MVWMSGVILSIGALLGACDDKTEQVKEKEKLTEVAADEQTNEIQLKEKKVSVDYTKTPEEILANYTEKGMNLFKVNFPDTLSMNYALKNIGKEAPSITGTTVDGKTVDLSKLKGKNVLISFSKTTCSVCKEMSPVVKGVLEDNKDVVLLNVFPVDNEQSIQAFYKGLKQEVPKNTLHLEKNKELKKIAVEQYQIEQVPTYVFVDKSGKISYTYIGNKDKVMFQDMINTAFGEEKLYDHVRTVTVHVDANGNEVKEELLIDEDSVDHTTTNVKDAKKEEVSKEKEPTKKK